jgi:hypothetical protein
VVTNIWRVNPSGDGARLLIVAHRQV